MRFRCDGIFNNNFIANFQEIVKVKKKIENRSVFDEVMPKKLLVRFFRTRCSNEWVNPPSLHHVGLNCTRLVRLHLGVSTIISHLP